MKAALTLGVWTLSLTAAGAGCAPHYHAVYYEGDYHHPHALGGGCVVRCHYQRGAHHYSHHGYRGAYWHQHHIGDGYYARGHVVRGVHYYERTSSQLSKAASLLSPQRMGTTTAAVLKATTPASDRTIIAMALPSSGTARKRDER